MRTAAVVGTGRTGSAIGTALRARGVAAHLLDVEDTAVRAAQARGRRKRPTSAAERGVAVLPVDIAVLAVPLARVATVFSAQ
jgi:predicted dinucleotide-binding enzyme